MNDETKIRWAAHLQRLRNDRGLTQGALASRIGVGQSAVGNWESGQIPKWDSMRAIAKGLNISLATLVAPLDDSAPLDVAGEIALIKERLDQLLTTAGHDLEDESVPNRPKSND